MSSYRVGPDTKYAEYLYEQPKEVKAPERSLLDEVIEYTVKVRNGEEIHPEVKAKRLEPVCSNCGKRH